MEVNHIRLSLLGCKGVGTAEATAALPRNAQTAGAKVSFRPRNNLSSLSAGS